MRVVKVSSLRQLASVVKRDTKALERRLDRARNRAAKKTVPYVRAHMPVAHSELRDSLEVDGSTVRATAPHAAAVERGSRPHMPPIAPIIAWVKLRHLQAQLSDKRKGRLPGISTFEQSKRVHDAVNARVDKIEAYFDRTKEEERAIKAVAWAIARSIAKHGTKPTWYMRNSVPFARLMLAEECEKAVRESSEV